MNQTRSSINLIDDGWAEIAELRCIQRNMDTHAMRHKQLWCIETLKETKQWKSLTGISVRENIVWWHTLTLVVLYLRQFMLKATFFSTSELASSYIEEMALCTMLPSVHLRDALRSLVTREKASRYNKLEDKWRFTSLLTHCINLLRKWALILKWDSSGFEKHIVVLTLIYVA